MLRKRAGIHPRAPVVASLRTARRRTRQQALARTPAGYSFPHQRHLPDYTRPVKAVFGGGMHTFKAGSGLTSRSSRLRFVPAKSWQKKLAMTWPPLRYAS